MSALIVIGSVCYIIVMLEQGPSGDTVCDESAVCEPCIDLRLQ